MAMTQELVACPYCNAQMPRPEASGRVVCSRCGEAFPWRPAFTDESSKQSPPLLSPPGGHAPTGNLASSAGLIQIAVVSVALAVLSLALKLALADNNTTQRAFPFMVLLSGIGLVASLWMWFFRRPRANTAIAFFVLGNMASVALMVLPFALATKAGRRANDPKGPQVEAAAAPSAVEAVAPAFLAGLGYLPEDCNLVAAIHVAELAAQPMGLKLLERHPSGEGEPPPWLIDFAFGHVEKLTGLKPEALDHLVLGTRIDAGLPHLTIVVRTRKPYDPTDLAKTQAPTLPVKHLDRDLYQFNTKPVGAGMLFAADPQTLVLVLRLDALAERDKQALAANPRTGAQGAPRLLRAILQERLGKGVLIWWAATEIERPEVAGMLLPLARMDDHLAKFLAIAKSVVVGLRLQQDAAVMAAVECPNGPTARRLEGALEQQTVEGLGSPKVFRPANVHVPTDDAERWVSFQLRGTPEAVAAALRPVRLLGRVPGKK